MSAYLVTIYNDQSLLASRILQSSVIPREEVYCIIQGKVR